MRLLERKLNVEMYVEKGCLKSEKSQKEIVASLEYLSLEYLKEKRVT